MLKIVVRSCCIAVSAFSITALSGQGAKADIFDQYTETMFNSIMEGNCSQVSIIARADFFDASNDYNGQDLLDVAVYQNLPCAVRALVSAGGDPSVAVDAVVRNSLCTDIEERREIVSYLKRLGATASRRVTPPNTSVLRWIRYEPNLENVDVCEKVLPDLVDFGLNLNIGFVDKCGLTPMDLIMTGNVTVIPNKKGKMHVWRLYGKKQFRAERLRIARVLESLGAHSSPYNFESSFDVPCPQDVEQLEEAPSFPVPGITPRSLP